MKANKPITSFISTLLILALAQSAMAVKVSKQEEAQWLHCVIPLPKQISIMSKVELPAAAVKIRLRQDAGEVVKTAAAELSALFKEKANVDASTGSFEILIGVCDKEGKIEGATILHADELAELPNWRQAYVIHAIDENRLVLTALDERGVYYAVQTLCQLLDTKFADGKVSMPLVTATDWPDISERGVWGGAAMTQTDLKWIAAHKLNLFEYPVRLKMTKDGGAVAGGIRSELIRTAHRHAIRTVGIMRLDDLGQAATYRMYPELKGKGPSARTCACASQSRLVEVLADFMGSAAEQGLVAISACLSEDYCQCSCEKCRPESQYALEARALVKAWQQTVTQYPRFGLRVLLTRGSYPDNEKVLAELPAGVGVTFYQGYTGLDRSREPMIYPLLERTAAEGRWLGVRLPMGHSDVAISPWTAPQYIQRRMTEFVRKKLKGVSGPVLADLSTYDFNNTAASEWSWNCRGRSEAELAAAWATRRAIKSKRAAVAAETDAVAEWAVQMGPVEWDIYGSGIPDSHLRGDAGYLVASPVGPVLGRGMFRYFPTVEHLDDSLTACDQATAIAEQLAAPSLLAETRVIQGYLRMLKEIYFIASQVSALDNPTHAERAALQEKMTRLTLAGFETKAALAAWQRTISPGVRGRLLTTLNMIDQTVIGIADALAHFGVNAFARPYLCKEVGHWYAGDFKTEERMVKRWDVTAHLPISGTWKVWFDRPGVPELYVNQVALASAPIDQPDELTELSVDAHRHTVGVGGSGCLYTLPLNRRDPALRYVIVAEMQKRRTTTAFDGSRGRVLMWAEKPEDWSPAAAAAEAQPLTDEELELAESQVPQFGTKGLRVAIIESSYAQDHILAYLNSIEGIDARALVRVNRFALRPCQVVVLSQLRAVMLDRAAIKALEDFVRQGGGLITTHDAVGYRHHPRLITDVCAGGSAHVKDTNWVVVKSHPVTAGIELKKTLTHSYYDHIELEPGPQGIVLANAPGSGQPVVIAGTSGEGRYVACGLIIGLSADDKEIPPAGAEAKLLANAVKWCGRQ